MEWMRLDVGYARHPKVLAVGPRLAMAHLRAMGWCAEQETGGHIPTAALRAIPLTPRDADALVEARLLDLNGDGYQVHDWTDYQPDQESMIVRRERTRERVRAHRQRQKEGGE